MKTKYKHIFFDLDRTLWDFDNNSERVLRDIHEKFLINVGLKSYNKFILKYKEINELLWVDYRDNKIDKEVLRWKRFYDTLFYFEVDNKELSDEIGEYYITHSPRQKGLFPHTKEVLTYLSETYKLHIITNGFNEVQHIKLKESGIDKFFDVIVLSETTGVKKPHPYIFKKALKLARATIENSIMIGDDWYADIYGAQKVGIDQIYFNFNGVLHDNEVQREINCLSELYDLL